MKETRDMDIPTVAHRFVEVEGVRVFYRETGPEDAPVLLLLHGFPSASHQFRRLIDALGTRFRLDRARLSRLRPHGGSCRLRVLLRGVDRHRRGIPSQSVSSGSSCTSSTSAGLSGSGSRSGHPEWIAGLVIQNANAYEDGLSERCQGDGLSPAGRPRRRGQGARAAPVAGHPRSVRGRHGGPSLGRPGRMDPRSALPRSTRPQGRAGRARVRLPLQRRPLPGVAAVVT